MIWAVRITKVDAVSENFAYQWAQKSCYNSFLRTGNTGCFPDGGVVALAGAWELTTAAVIEAERIP